MTIASLNHRVLHVACACLTMIGGTLAAPLRAAEDVDPKPAEAAVDVDPAEAQQREQLKQLTTHWEGEFSKILHSHLELTRAICGDLPVASRRAIAHAGEASIKEAAVAMASTQMGRMRRGAKAARAPANTPSDQIATAIEKAVREHVGDEQATALATELATRNDRRKKSSATSIVSMLDAHLVLTSEQREVIARSLLERWNDGMYEMITRAHWNNGRLTMPGVPDDCILPHLTQSQRDLFSPSPQQGMDARAMALNQRMIQLGRISTPMPRDPWWFE
ncbi:MAG: hypothetical protein ACKOEX_04620 [Planctomycetia bacterium]